MAKIGLDDLLKIKVDIRDGDAIHSIPWENARDYLTRSPDWDKVLEKQIGSIWKYRHHVWDERSGGYTKMVVFLPETREIADYALRMKELVAEIAVATGKSQLGIYIGLINGDLE